MRMGKGQSTYNTNSAHLPFEPPDEMQTFLAWGSPKRVNLPEVYLR